MLSKHLQQRFILARPWFSLIATYAVSLMLAALFLRLTSGREALDYQAAFFANAVSIASLWAALLIGRPKPKRPSARTLYVAFEYVLVALIFSLALILFFHHGWSLRGDAPTGFAAIAWGIGWIGSWLGPMVIAILALSSGHWLWLHIFIDYRSACWNFIHETRTSALLNDLLDALQQDQFLRPKDAEYVGRKLIHWHSTASWKPFELGLPSTGVHLYGYLQAADAALPAHLTLQKLPHKGDERVLQSITLSWPAEPTAN